MKRSFQHGFPLFKSEAENHEQHKTKILTDVLAMPRHGIKENGIRLTSCDWAMNEDVPRHYWDAGYKAVESLIKQVCDLLGFSNWKVLERWFQYYEQGIIIRGIFTETLCLSVFIMSSWKTLILFLPLNGENKILRFPFQKGMFLCFHLIYGTRLRKQQVHRS